MNRQQCRSVRYPGSYPFLYWLKRPLLKPMAAKTHRRNEQASPSKCAEIAPGSLAVGHLLKWQVLKVKTCMVLLDGPGGYSKNMFKKHDVIICIHVSSELPKKNRDSLQAKNLHQSFSDLENSQSEGDLSPDLLLLQLNPESSNFVQLKVRCCADERWHLPYWLGFQVSGLCRWFCLHLKFFQVQAARKLLVPSGVAEDELEVAETGDTMTSEYSLVRRVTNIGLLLTAPQFPRQQKRHSRAAADTNQVFTKNHSSRIYHQEKPSKAHSRSRRQQPDSVKSCNVNATWKVFSRLCTSHARFHLDKCNRWTASVFQLLGSKIMLTTSANSMLTAFSISQQLSNDTICCQKSTSPMSPCFSSPVGLGARSWTRSPTWTVV